MKKANKTKLHLGMETIKRMSLPDVRGGQIYRGSGPSNADSCAPYECITLSCTSAWNTQNTTVGGTATVFCTTP